MTSFSRHSYAARVDNFENVAAKRLLQCMERKRSNLSVAADVTTAKELLAIADVVGPSICCLKTHIDVMTDFTYAVAEDLMKLAKKHDFLIFEDRKFADIGNTVKLQYQAGIYRIADWSDITNAHPIPGEGIIQGLAEVGMPKERGLLLLAEMSSKGNLCSPDYAQETYEMAKRNRAFVFGFIGQRRLTNSQGVEEADFIYMTPGVGLHALSDALGQQYRSPQQVIQESGCDVIIVGRAIYGSLFEDKMDQVVQKAEEYRKQGWESYIRRTTSQL